MEFYVHFRIPGSEKEPGREYYFRKAQACLYTQKNFVINFIPAGFKGFNFLVF